MNDPIRTCFDTIDRHALRRRYLVIAACALAMAGVLCVAWAIMGL